MEKVVFQIDTIEEYGKLIAYCIEKDISVFRSFWRVGYCYRIDFVQKRLWYSRPKYWINEGYRIVKPEFVLDKFGTYCKVRYE